MSDRPARVIVVDIHGQRYPVRSTLNEAYVQQLATYVDAKMRVAAQEAPTGDSQRIAILAALNIADEYFRRHEDDPGFTSAEITRRATALEHLVDEALAAAGDHGRPRLQGGD